MSIPTCKINNQQVQKILSMRENQYTDMKSCEVQPKKLTRHLAAFANADGGDLYLGVAEEKNESFVWAGFTNEKEANGHLQALNEMFPVGSDFLYEFLEAPKRAGLVLHIEITN